jgi:predicted ATPase
MIFLRSVELRPLESVPPRFPFSLPFVKAFERLDFTHEVTFLVGENGTGKSTFLEILACAAGSITVGSENVRTDKTLAPQREFSNHLKLTWSRKTRRGFFMRAEDFFGYARKMDQMREDLQSDLRAVDEEYQGRSRLAQELAKMPYQNEIGAIRRAYGEGLDHNSHGEGFLKLFQQRFVGEGLYLLDEPEAPLSPQRQLALLALIKTMVDQNGQFIIATHSPILMAYPGAHILSFDGGILHAETYETLESVSLTRAFLNNPQAYLRHLMQ